MELQYYKDFFYSNSSEKYDRYTGNMMNKATKHILLNEWQFAGETFLLCAEPSFKTDSSEVVEYYVKAGDCFAKSCDTVNAIRAYNKAIGIYSLLGRFYKCAKCYDIIAKLYEQDHNINDALNAYLHAVDFYGKDNRPMEQKNMQTKVAEMYILNSNFKLASEAYEKIGLYLITTRTCVHSAKTYFFRCLLCIMATGDYVQLSNKFVSFKDTDYIFGSSREGIFIEKLIKSIDDMNVESFSDACWTYDNITPFDGLLTKILINVKSSFAVLDEGDEEVNLS